MARGHPRSNKWTPVIIGLHFGIATPFIIVGLALTCTVFLAPIGIPMMIAGAAYAARPLRKELGTLDINKRQKVREVEPEPMDPDEVWGE